MSSSTADKLPVLIDADNAQASIASELLGEVARHGTATVTKMCKETRSIARQLQHVKKLTRWRTSAR